MGVKLHRNLCFSYYFMDIKSFTIFYLFILLSIRDRTSSSARRWLSAKIMSNEILVSGLKQRDGHVPSTWMVLDAILSVRLGLQESMKNPRLNGDNRVPDGSLHRRKTGGFFSFECDAVSQDDTLLPNERKSERKNGWARALFSGLWNPWEVSNLVGNSL